MEERFVKRLSGVMEDSVVRGETAGATLLVCREGREEVYLESGFADVEGKKPMRRDTIFRLYSMSKPVTAAAVMLLCERGLVDLLDPVSRYLPGFQNQAVYVNGERRGADREVTVCDLMNMTSGLTYGGVGDRTEMETELLFSEVIRRLPDADGGVGTVEFANRLGRIPLAYQPGTSWRYGTSADVAGALVEIVSGKRFGEFLREEFFEPLDMRDTGFWVPDEKRSRLAKAYICEEGKEPALFTGNHLGIRNAMDRPPAFESGGAGLVSTIDDYQRFARMLLAGGVYGGRRILEEGTVRYLTGHILNAVQQPLFHQWIGLEGFSYGNFLRVLCNPGRATTLGRRGEYGWDGWLGCYFANAPEEKMTILMMTQKKDSGTFALTRKIRNIVYSSL